jgi:DNA-binding transcriptional MerR regulator
MRVLTENLYQASEFARKAGFSVRRLHHYDRIGLLRPRRYTGQGFRLYGEKEFARLQIFKFLYYLKFQI